MWQDLLLDLRAALRLRHPDSLSRALEAIARHPEIAANRRLSARLQSDFLRPAGRMLAEADLPSARLRALCAAPLAGMRALGAAALAYRYAQERLPLEALRQPGRDARSEVRRLLGLTLAEAGAASPEKLLALGRAWLPGDSPRLRHTALLALRGAAAARGEALFPLLETLPQTLETESSEALSALLTALAQHGHHESVLRLLEARADAAPPDLWLAGRVLSGRWAAAHTERVAALLEALEARHGVSRHIRNARRALRRHAREPR